MSQFGLIYRLEFQSIENRKVRIDIYPTDILIDDADSPQIIDLKGGDVPLTINVSDNDEDKLAVIRSKSAQIKFRSDQASGLDSSTFSQGGDNLWRVDITLPDLLQDVFKGFLIMADNQQPFQPDPQYVTLTATDHLAALKEAKLTDLEGLNPVGKYRVADLINFCLRKTGLALDFYVVNNLRAGGGRFTMAVEFDGAADTMTVADTKMFYVGQRIVISGTASNNYSTYVLGKTPTVIQLGNVVTTESAPAAVILDYNSQFHWYDVVHLDAKTFETIIGESEDCYRVLEKILGEDCFITQWRGVWWIFRVDEMEDNPVYAAQFDSAGLYVSTAGAAQYDMNIGFTEDRKFANADTLLRFIRPHGYVRETFNYNTPLEVPCNVNFSRGNVVDDVPPEKTYDIECWTLRRGLPGAYNTPITITALIVRQFNDNDREIERYIRITPETGHVGFSSTDDEYIESEGILVQQDDKFTASIQWRFDQDIGSSSARLRLFRFILKGDDGSYWILGRPADTGGADETVQWYNTSGWTTNTARGSTPIIFGDQDEREWQSIDWTAPPVPVGGELFIWINQAYTNAAVPSNTIIEYSNLRFDYIPLIDGSYAEVSGQSNRVDRTETGYIANRDREVYISDSPTKLYKGAMFLDINNKWIIPPYWFSAAPFSNSYPPNTDYLHPYGYIQIFSVWNQFKGVNETLPGGQIRGKGINIFPGTVKNMVTVVESVIDWPELLFRFSLTDANVQTNDRYFILISFSQDWKSCLSTNTFIEVYNRVIFKTYDDPFEFEYLNE